MEEEICVDQKALCHDLLFFKYGTILCDDVGLELIFNSTVCIQVAERLMFNRNG